MSQSDKFTYYGSPTEHRGEVAPLRLVLATKRRRSAFRAFNKTAYGRDHGLPIRNPYAGGAPMSDLFGGQHDSGGPGTADHAAAQSNSLALAVPSPDLDNRSDAWMRHRRVWRGVASIIHRNNARRA